MITVWHIKGVDEYGGLNPHFQYDMRIKKDKSVEIKVFIYRFNNLVHEKIVRNYKPGEWLRVRNEN